MKPKIFWTPEEDAWVTAYLWNLGTRATSKGLANLIQAAQQSCLPAWRQRRISGAYSIRSTVALLTEWEATKRGEVTVPEPLYSKDKGKPVQGRARKLAIEATAATSRAKRAAETVSGAMPAVLVPAEIREAPESSVLPAASGPATPLPATQPTNKRPLFEELDGALLILAQALAGRFLGHLQDALVQQAEGRLAGIVEAVSPGALKPRLPKVLILGLLPQQAGLIQQEFGTCFELRFWKEEGSSKLNSQAKGAEYVFGMTDFMHHADEQTIKRLPQYQRVGGGLTTLREALTKLYVERDAATAT